VPACTLLFYLSVFFEKTLPKKGRLGDRPLKRRRTENEKGLGSA
jgi:hypothetical protein